MAVTGIVMYFVPQGRIAYWVDWRFLGLTKVEWGNIHIVASILFVAAGIYHIYYNWKPLVNYIYSKISHGLRLKKELTIVTAVSLFVIIGSIYQVPPVNYVINFSEYLKKSWIVSTEYEPPFGHAEELSLKVFARKMNIDLDRALTELKAKGIVVKDINNSLDEIAKFNRTNPMNLYMVIKQFEQKAQYANRASYTPENVEEQFAGTGLGRKTLSQVCENTGVDIMRAKERLNENSIEIKENETLREASDRYHLNPIDIMQVILVDNYRVSL
jgi:hypothetical protein